MLSEQDILARQGELEADRAIEEPAWRDIAHILRPDDEEFDPVAAAQRTRQDYDVFDSTPLYALDQFSGGLFGEATNPAERWMEITIEDKDRAKFQPVKTWLWNTASLLYASAAPSVSTFYPQIPAAFANTGAFGQGVMYQQEHNRAFVDRAVPHGEIYVGIDIDGRVNQVNRKFARTGKQLKDRFGDAAREAKDDTRYVCVHAVYVNPDYTPGKFGDRGKPFMSTYLSSDLKGFRVDNGYYEMPYHFFRWNERSGRAWPTGPGHNARPDMNTNNEMARSDLVSTQFDAEPPILLRDENSLMTAADIVPNAVLPGTLNERGQAQVAFLQRGEKNAPRVEAKIQQRREAIREAFHYGVMQVINRPQMTATEFMGWKEEKLRLLGPSLVRIQVGLATWVSRRFAILARARQILPPPPELAGHKLAIEFVSPMAKAQKAATGRAVMQWMGMLGQMAEFSNDPTVFDVVNKDSAARVLHDAVVGVPDVINDEKTVAMMRDARAKQQRQVQGAEQAANMASVFADVAHAKQAMTSADQRGK